MSILELYDGIFRIFNTLLFCCFLGVKPWPKSMQVYKTRTCVRTCKGGQTDSQIGLQVSLQVAKSRKFHTYNWLMHFTTDYLRSTCVDLRWLAKWQKTCIYLCLNLSSTKVNARCRKANGWPNETQVELKQVQNFC